jgi:pyrimidine-nucleoside phosphorylase
VTDWDPREVIADKRDGRMLAPDRIERFVVAFSRGEVGEGPTAAFLMACLLNGLDADETLAMTRAMVGSGETLGFDHLGRPSIDKHSTGGVADGVTLVFAPLAAALDLAVAKLSGRGLGHTGGTIDKLEAIPGFRTDLSPEEIVRQVNAVGCAVAAQSANLVPADAAMYTLRHATATVPSLPLIAASVMSKKLAVRTDLILLDVKAGSGAFMRTSDDALRLAETCRSLAEGWGRPCRAAVTDMSQPLGDAIGNALDVREAIDVLRGQHRGRLRELSVWLVARALEASRGVAFDDALVRAGRALDDGSALERFAAMVAAQGGDPRAVDDPAAMLPAAPVVRAIAADRAGTVVAMRTRELGEVSAGLGAGRIRQGDEIDPAVGIVMRAKIGDRLQRGQPIGEVHARSARDADRAAAEVSSALEIGDGPVDPPALIHAWLD